MTVAFDSHGQPPEAVLAALDDIVASPYFEASERNKRFLRFVVTEALAGRADHIKAYTVATVVFGRDASFDPQTDPIIRIEASRLRRALEHYYLTGGRDAPVRIEIPKGSYVPVIVAQPVVGSAMPEPAASPAATPLREPEHAVGPPPEPPTPPAPQFGRRSALASPFRLASFSAALGALAVGILGYVFWAPAIDRTPSAESATRGVSILVAPFEDDGSAPPYAAVARGFSREMVVGLTRYKDLHVYVDQGLPGAPTPGLARSDVDYLLQGAVSITEDRLRGAVILVEAKSGRHLWSDRFDSSLSPASIYATREEIATRLTQALAQTYGVLFTEKAKTLAGKPPRLLSSYECVVQFYAYQRAVAASLYDDAKQCLERTVAAEPTYSQALAGLAILYVDAHRFAFAREKVNFPPLPRARELAQRAIDQDPEEPQGYKAMHNVLWLMNDVPGSLAMGERAVRLNPYDTEAVGDLGARRFYTGDWEAGLALIRETFDRNPAAPDAYRIPLVLTAYFQGRYADALAEAQRIKLPDFIYTHVLVAMSAAALAREDDTAQAVRRILAIEPAFASKAVADLRSRNQHPRIIRAVAEGLTRAGLPIEGMAQISEAGLDRRDNAP